MLAKWCLEVLPANWDVLAGYRFKNSTGALHQSALLLFHVTLFLGFPTLDL